MSRSYRLRRPYLVVSLTLLAVIGGWVLVVGNLKVPHFLTAVQSRLWKAPESAQLVYYDPLPAEAMDDESCGPPASVDAALAAESGDGDIGADAAFKKPVRMIRDRYAAFSSIAVDARNNEVVLTDENLFNVLVFDRLDNTPPAKATQPKRAIGGLKTRIEFQSGSYVDPKIGDIYAVNNDTVDTLVIFARGTKGDVRPARELHTPHGTFAIAVDEERQEMLLTVQHDSAVVTFPKSAKAEDAPIRLLQGEHTLLADPHGIAYTPTVLRALRDPERGGDSGKGIRQNARLKRRAHPRPVHRHRNVQFQGRDHREQGDREHCSPHQWHQRRAGQQLQHRGRRLGRREHHACEPDDHGRECRPAGGRGQSGFRPHVQRLFGW
jgi:hypothetical protein